MRDGARDIIEGRTGLGEKGTYLLLLDADAGNANMYMF